MTHIETERYKPDPGNPNWRIYDGQRPAQEVFDELRQRLMETGHLPDEYFLFDHDWENGRLWPEDGSLTCTVDYGNNEGIYLDIAMQYPDEKQKWQTKHFATGKTLGETDADMDRMYLIASAVTKAFHIEGLHARWMLAQTGTEGETK